MKYDIDKVTDAYIATRSHMKAFTLCGLDVESETKEYFRLRTAVNKRLKERAMNAPYTPPPQEAGEAPGATEGPDSICEESHGHTQVEVDGKTIKTSGSLMPLEDLMDKIGVDRDEWRVHRWTANIWDGADGTPKGQTKAHLERVPVYMQGPDPVILRRKRVPGHGTTKQTTLVLADGHVGYEWNFDEKCLVPYHDEYAMDIALQMAEHVKPDTIVLVGDMLDLAAWSTKFRRSPEQRYLSQPALDYLHKWLVKLRTVCPSAEIVYLKGNHEERIMKFLVEQADELMGLKADNGFPLLSVTNLLHLPELDIDYRDDFWVGGVHLHHGTTVRKGGGSTAAAVMKESLQSTAYGHIHRREYAERTVHGPDGTHSFWAASPGCLCRTDGTVPGVNNIPDWQNGAGVITSYKNGPDVWESARIENDRGYYRGEIFVASPEVGE